MGAGTEKAPLNVFVLVIRDKKSPPMRTRNIYEAKYSPISALRLRSFAIASRSI
jgi:hypothetical protein